MSPPIAGKPDCEEVIKIYPVRYAYTGLLTEEFKQDIQLPTDIKSVLDSSDYRLRILREGWVYIKEIDNDNEHLRVVKYTKPSDKNKNTTGLQEHFEHYIFSDKDITEEPETSEEYLIPLEGYTGLPFASKCAPKIKIVYTQHELSFNVLKKLNNSDNNDLPMQVIDLSAEETEHSMPFSAKENQGLSIVEDYKQDEAQCTLFNAFTSEKSYRTESIEDNQKVIDRYLPKKEGVKEKAIMVALHDPVGYQLDIVHGHSMANVLKDAAIGAYSYPYTIGLFAQAFLKSKNEEIKNMAISNLRHKELQDFMDDVIGIQKVKDAVTAFKAFFAESMVSNSGSLYLYFKHLFDYAPSKNLNLNLEVQKIANLYADIFHGMAESQEGQEMIEELIIEAYQEVENEEQQANKKNAYIEPLNIIKELLSLAEYNQSWEANTYQAVSRMFDSLSSIWAKHKSLVMEKMRLEIKNGALFLSDACLSFAVSAIDEILDKIFNIKLSGETVNIQTSDLLNMLAEFQQKQTVRIQQSGIPAKLESALNKARENFNRITHDIDWKIPKLNMPSFLSNMNLQGTSIIQQGVVHTGGALTIGLGGVSAYFNILTLNSINAQVDDAEGVVQSAQIKAAFIFLINDTLSASNGILQATRVIAHFTRSLGMMSQNALLTFLGKIKKAYRPIVKILSSKLFNFILGVGSTFLAVASFYEASSKWQDGKYLEASLNYANSIVTGSMAVLTFYAIGVALFTGAKISAVTVYGAPVGAVLAILGIVSIVISLVIALITDNPLEVLLQSCFWGINDKYNYWQNLPSGKEVYTLEERLNIITSVNEATTDEASVNALAEAFEVESQAFLNLLFKPSLIKKQSKPPFSIVNSYHLTFKLPGFNPSNSTLIVEVYEYVGRKKGTFFGSEYVYNAQMTKDLNWQITEDLSKRKNFQAIDLVFNTNSTRPLYFYWVYNISDDNYGTRNIPTTYIKALAKPDVKEPCYVITPKLIGMWDNEPIDINQVPNINLLNK